MACLSGSPEAYSRGPDDSYIGVYVDGISRKEVKKAVFFPIVAGTYFENRWLNEDEQREKAIRGVGLFTLWRFIRYIGHFFNKPVWSDFLYNNLDKEGAEPTVPPWLKGDPIANSIMLVISQDNTTNTWSLLRNPLVQEILLKSSTKHSRVPNLYGWGFEFINKFSINREDDLFYAVAEFEEHLLAFVSNKLTYMGTYPCRRFIKDFFCLHWREVDELLDLVQRYIQGSSRRGGVLLDKVMMENRLDNFIRRARRMGLLREEFVAMKQLAMVQGLTRITEENNQNKEYDRILLDENAKSHKELPIIDEDSPHENNQDGDV